MTRFAQSVPVAGMPATYWIGSDRNACTVIDVSPSGRIVVTRDVRVTRWEPWPSGYAAAYEPDDAGTVRRFTRRADGRYRRTGTGDPIGFGRWDAYRDPHI